MNPFETLVALYRGQDPGFHAAAFSPELRSQIDADVRSIANDGARLLIEPQGSMAETITDRSDGRREYRYEGSVLYAFERDGALRPDPSAEPFARREEAIDIGTFTFVVDAGGTVIGWADDLTGNSYGTEPRRNGSLVGRIVIAGLVIFSLVEAVRAVVLGLGGRH